MKEMEIHGEYVHLNFDWQWIKDKQMSHTGDWDAGMLIITDMDDNVVRIIGYELISNEEDNKEQ